MVKSILKSILVSIDRSSDSTPAIELCGPRMGEAVRGRAGRRRVHRRVRDRGLRRSYLYKEGYLIPSVNPPLIARVQQDYRLVIWG